MGVSEIRANIAGMRVAGVVNPSALCCLEDAELCLVRAAGGVTFPEYASGSWVESAAVWTARAGQHAYGFALPAWWRS